MVGTQHPKVAEIQRPQLGLVQALDYREDSRVYEADVGISIAVADLSDPTIILRQHVLHQVGAVRNVIQESNQNPRV